VSGIAWSGQGTITQVEVSADGGQTWAAAVLSAPVLPRALTRFRIAWKWNGAPAVLKSRATDDSGAVQPTRDALVRAHGTNAIFHYNAIQAWQVEKTGEVNNVYA
jgi:sulfane dehydrogenase subunit SoxC